jgi:hypothetical protein
MSDKKRPRKMQRPRYKWSPGAVCVTLHSTDGSPVNPEVLNALAEYAESLARTNNCLVNVARA